MCASNASSASDVGLCAVINANVDAPRQRCARRLTWTFTLVSTRAPLKRDSCSFNLMTRSSVQCHCTWKNVRTCALRARAPADDEVGLGPRRRGSVERTLTNGQHGIDITAAKEDRSITTKKYVSQTKARNTRIRKRDCTHVQKSETGSVTNVVVYPRRSS